MDINIAKDWAESMSLKTTSSAGDDKNDNSTFNVSTFTMNSNKGMDGDLLNILAETTGMMITAPMTPSPLASPFITMQERASFGNGITLNYNVKPAPSSAISRKNQKTLERCSYILSSKISDRRREKALYDLVKLRSQPEALSQYHEAQLSLYLGFYIDGRSEDDTPLEKAKCKIHFLMACIEYCNRGVIASRVSPDDDRVELVQPYYDLMYSARRDIRSLRLKHGLIDTEIEMLCPSYDVVEDFEDVEEEELTSEEEFSGDDDMELDNDDRDHEQKQDDYDVIASRIARPQAPDPVIDTMQERFDNTRI